MHAGVRKDAVLFVIAGVLLPVADQFGVPPPYTAAADLGVGPPSPCPGPANDVTPLGAWNGVFLPSLPFPTINGVLAPPKPMGGVRPVSGAIPPQGVPPPIKDLPGVGPGVAFPGAPRTPGDALHGYGARSEI
ncbi:hypothetical protein CF336_g3062 [Tilletia laevis]|uniref:Uncharacterized protein n=1 Tax=Tilletia caries TaxID=13290 RepID=A0A177UMY5_9BASI|nr:hypothetical protein CF336_g3062 [Tilletia laevis]KAE8200698.1 hypothetical protein CF335_g3901 [Tilletia laevis]KAE8257435.1 hypothetical protein A4X03_0g4668 [Tilletia caries]